MNSGSPECQGGYPMPKTTPKRCVSTVKSQPEPRLALKRRESRVYKTWLSLNPLRGCFLNIEAESRNGAKQELRSPRQTEPSVAGPIGRRVGGPVGRTSLQYIAEERTAPHHTVFSCGCPIQIRYLYHPAKNRASHYTTPIHYHAYQKGQMHLACNLLRLLDS